MLNTRRWILLTFLITPFISYAYPPKKRKKNTTKVLKMPKKGFTLTISEENLKKLYDENEELNTLGRRWLSKTAQRTPLFHTHIIEPINTFLAKNKLPTLTNVATWKKNLLSIAPSEEERIKLLFGAQMIKNTDNNSNPYQIILGQYLIRLFLECNFIDGFPLTLGHELYHTLKDKHDKQAIEHIVTTQEESEADLFGLQLIENKKLMVPFMTIVGLSTYMVKALFRDVEIHDEQNLVDSIITICKGFYNYLQSTDFKDTPQRLSHHESMQALLQYSISKTLKKMNSKNLAEKKRTVIEHDDIKKFQEILLQEMISYYNNDFFISNESYHTTSQILKHPNLCERMISYMGPYPMLSLFTL